MSNQKAMSVSVGMEANPHNDAEQKIVSIVNDVCEGDIAALAYERWQARGCRPDRQAKIGFVP